MITASELLETAMLADEYSATLAEIQRLAVDQANNGPSFNDRHTLLKIAQLIIACFARIEESQA